MRQDVSFEAEWARCSPWLEAALARGGDTHTLADVKAQVCDPEARTRFWAGRGAALVTRIEDHPRYRAVHGWLAGGDMDEIVGSLIPLAEAWGRAQGCARATVLGRDGWRRKLAGGGYGHAATLLVKEL